MPNIGCPRWLWELGWSLSPRVMTWLVLRRDARFVRQALARLDDCPIIYLHPNPESSMSGVLTRPELVTWSEDAGDHDHLEGNGP